MAGFPYILKAAFGRGRCARARFARPCSPATPGPRAREAPSLRRQRAARPSPSSCGPGVSQVDCFATGFARLPVDLTAAGPSADALVKRAAPEAAGVPTEPPLRPRTTCDSFAVTPLSPVTAL